MSDRFSGWFDDLLEQELPLYVKRLSANDVGETGAHQAGPYIPNRVLFSVFPTLQVASTSVREVFLVANVVSHEEEVEYVRAVFYESKNEGRITRWGGSTSALLQPDAMGAVCVFAFRGAGGGRDASACDVWLSRSGEEDDIIERALGELVGPGSRAGLYFPAGHEVERLGFDLSRCGMSADEIPESWFTAFPSTTDVHEMAVRRVRAGADLSPDVRLMRRLDCETTLFYSIEREVVLPQVTQGFESIDAFTSIAKSVLARRKSRRGRSFELQTERIFREEGIPFTSQALIDRKQIDFVFPGREQYLDDTYPAERLRMLSLKSTIRERWDGIVKEATRIREKHLLTIQEGVPESTLTTMARSNVRLVVPDCLIGKYPKETRDNLVELSRFIDETQNLVS